MVVCHYEQPHQEAGLSVHGDGADLIRREMGVHFGSLPALADGLFLRIWRGGPQRGEPKIPPAVQSVLARGLVEVGMGRMGPRAFFTPAGMAALRQLVLDRRHIDSERFAHLRRELDFDSAPGAGA